MEWHFVKYQGTGNDFIMIDDRSGQFPETDHELIRRYCERRFGVGADGLILIRLHEEYDFEMVYFNADGHQTSMCGNGGRCAVAFAKELGLIAEQARFLAIDGVHQADIDGDLVSLGMNDVTHWEATDQAWVMDTGSPHYVCEGSLGEDFLAKALKIRHSQAYRQKGINVNFLQWGKDHVKARTFERGVEAETFSCGTGAVAMAIAAGIKGYQSPISIQTKGGELSVSWKKRENGGFEEVKLIGPANRVFAGIISAR